MLEKRRKELIMGRAELAKLCGMSAARVHTVLDNFEYLNDICIVLGLDIKIKEIMSGYQFRKQRAEAKATNIISMIQGSSQLENQGVEAQTLREMEAQTVHELMAGPGNQLWAPLT